MTSLTATAGRSQRDWDGLQFRAIFAACVPICLCVAGSRRLSPAFWRDRTTARNRLLVEAFDTAGSMARLALAG